MEPQKLKAYWMRSIKGFVLVLLISILSVVCAFADPITWSSKTSMLTPRSRAASAEANGKIYVLGGSTNSGSTAAVEMYDPLTDSWQTKPSLPESKFAGAEAVQGNTVYIAGGGGSLTSIISYDLNTGSGSNIGSLVTGRMRASAAIVNNKMYVVGGSNGGTSVLDTIEEFDLSLRTSSIKATMPAPRQVAAVVAVQGKLYIIGGLNSSGLPVNTCWLYDPVTDTFTDKSPVPNAVGSRTYVASNGKIYLIGGVTNFNDPMTWITAIQEYSPDTDSWREIGNFPTSRYAAVAHMVNNTLYVIGGDDGQPVTPNTLSVNEAASLAQVLISPLSHDFGTVNTYTTSPDQAFTLSNGSTTSLVVGSTTIEGMHAGQFSVTPGSCLSLTPTIAAGGSCTLNVAFTPTAAESANATLQIVLTDAGNTTLTVPLSGAGIVPDTTPPTTTVSPAGGMYAAAQTVSLAANEPATIYYTVDGSDPTTASPVYGGPLTISVSTALKFLAVDTAGNAESIKFAMYIIDSGSTGIDVWSAAGAMATSRSRHSATLLPNGKVLIAGGGSSSAELYDPANKSWSAAGSMSTTREWHTATLLPSGKVLVAGGDGAGSSVELYDPATNSWSLAASMSTDRQAHTATLLPNGKVLVTGGWHPSGGVTILSSAELYDPATNGWSSAGAMVISRFNHTATLLPNGKVLVVGGLNFYNSQLYDPATNSWSLAGPIIIQRQGHTATLLPNGKVLVTGGEGYSGTLSSTELYNPATNSWSIAGSMSAVRTDHTATLFPNGKVLVAGGSSYGSVASAELYDPATNSWSTAGLMATARMRHTATLLLNGRVLVAGSSTAELYGPDPTTTASPAAGAYNTPQTVTLTVNKPATIYYTLNGTDPTTASPVYSGPLSISVTTTVKFFARDAAGNSEPVKTAVYQIDTTPPVTSASPGAGTYATARTVTLTANEPSTIYYTIDGLTPTTASSVYYGPITIYSSTTIKYFAKDSLGNVENVKSKIYTITGPGGGIVAWSAAGAMTTPRDSHTATLLPNGKVLVAGGNNGNYLSSAELYDFTSNSWTSVNAMGYTRMSHTATMLPNGKVLVAGGYGLNGGYYDQLSDAELFDPASNSWSWAAYMSNSRENHTATLLPNGKVLVVGGYSNYGDYLGSAELYDPASNSWSSAGSMSTVRAYHTATLLSNGKVLVAGGDNYAGYLFSAELYDPATNSWSSIGSMAYPRAHHTATALPNGKVLVAGSIDISSAELYDPAANSWSVASSMSGSRWGHSATLLTTGKVMVAGGNGQSSSELYNPATNSWSPAGYMAIPRGSHTGTLLPTGKVLVAGGYASSFLSSAELYDPAGDPIPPITTASPLGGLYSTPQTVTLTANESATIYYTLNGVDPTTASSVYSGPITISATTTLKFFARDLAGNSGTISSAVYTIDTITPVTTASPAGGTYPTQANVFLFANEPATIYYSTDGSEPTTASPVYSGPIVITSATTLKFFARDSAGNSEAVQAHAYEISGQGASSWSTKAPLPYGISRAVSAVVNGRIFIFGGSPPTPSVINYDPVVDSWNYGAPLPMTIFGGAAAVQGSTVYLVGGIDEQWNYLNSVIAYNTIDGTSTMVGSLITPRARMNATVLNNKIYVVGGSNAMDTMEVFDLGSNTSVAVTLPEPTQLAGVAVYQDKIIIAAAGTGNTKTWSFDPVSGMFTALSPLPTTAEGRNLIVHNDRLYLVDGWGYGNINYVFEYNFTTNIWNIVTTVPTFRNVPSVEAVNGVLYVMGGDYSPGNVNEAWRFASAWTVNSVNSMSPDQIDWQSSQHAALSYGKYVKIGAFIYFVQGPTGMGTWSGMDYFGVSLYSCDQITGVVFGPANLTGVEGQEIREVIMPLFTYASPGGGTYSSTQYVYLGSMRPAIFYYTTDGTEPTTASAVYSSQLAIDVSTTLKYIAVDIYGYTDNATKIEVYTINKQSQSIDFAALPPQGYGAAPFTLNATTTSGLYVSYVSSNPAVATVSGNTLTIVGAGTTTITAFQEGDSNYTAAAQVSRELTVSKAATGIVLNSIAPVSSNYGEQVVLTATVTPATAGGTVQFSNGQGWSQLAVVTGGTVQLTTTTIPGGINSINAQYQGDGNYLDSLSNSLTQPVNKAGQSITFSPLPNRTIVDVPFPLGATASSGLPLSYISTNPAVATVSGTTVTIVGIGETTIIAGQWGDGNYNSANTVSQPLTVTKATAVITLGNLAATYDGSPKTVTATTIPAGLAVNVTYNGSTTAPANAGSYTVVATVNTATYLGSTTETLTIAKAEQTINFDDLPNKTYGEAPFTLNAIASSGKAVSYTSSTTTVATVSGTMVTIVGAGTTTITANQAGDANFNPAPAATVTFTVGKAAATVTLGNLTATYDGTAKAATATTVPAGLTVNFTYDTLTSAPTAAKDYYAVIGTISDANYQGSAAGNLIIAKATTTVNVSSSTPNPSTYGQAATVTAVVSPSGTSGKVQFSNGLGWTQLADVNVTNGNASITNDSLPSGSNTITAQYLGDGNHTQSLISAGYTQIVNKANQSITFPPLPNKMTGDADFFLNATASSGLPITYSSSNTAVAQVVGNRVIIIGAGSANIIASQWGDSNYNAPTSVPQQLLVISSTQGIKMNDGGSDAYFSTLSAAYSAITLGSNTTFQLPSITLVDTLIFDKNYQVSLRGGYDSLSGLYTGVTAIQGSITIQNGTVVIDEGAVAIM